MEEMPGRRFDGFDNSTQRLAGLRRRVRLCVRVRVCVCLAGPEQAGTNRAKEIFKAANSLQFHSRGMR